jgi:hypothetical protein
MASNDQEPREEPREELCDSFEIELSELSGAESRSILQFWRARLPGAIGAPDQRRRRLFRVLVMATILSLVLINTLDLSEYLPNDLFFFVPSGHSGSAQTAQAKDSSWFALRQRPLHLPKLAPGDPCPVTPLTLMGTEASKFEGLGDSTIFAAAPAVDADGVQHLVRNPFARLANTYQGELVTWYLQLPRGQGVMIRGHQLDGPNPILFDGGIAQPSFDNYPLDGRALPELLIASIPEHGSPVSMWPSVTRLTSSGCYAYQIDTPTKTMVLVFQAVLEP